MASEVWYCPTCGAENRKSVLREDYEKKLARGELSGEDLCYGCYGHVDRTAIYAGALDMPAGPACEGEDQGQEAQQAEQRKEIPAAVIPRKPESMDTVEVGPRRRSAPWVRPEELQEAEERWSAVLVGDPGNIEALRKLADVYQTRGKLADTLGILERLQDVLEAQDEGPHGNQEDPVFDNVMRMIHFVLSEEDDPEQAFGYIGKALSRAPMRFADSEKMLYLKGYSGDVEELNAHVEALSERAGSAVEACVALFFCAALRADEIDWKKAKHLLKRAEERHPGFGPVQRLRAEVFLGLEDYPRAIKEYTRALGTLTAPLEQAAVMEEIAIIHEINFEDRDTAEKWYRKATELRLGLPLVEYPLPLPPIFRGPPPDDPEALEARCRLALASDPEDTKALGTLSELLHRRGEHVEGVLVDRRLFAAKGWEEEEQPDEGIEELAEYYWRGFLLACGPLHDPVDAMEWLDLIMMVAPWRLRRYRDFDFYTMSPERFRQIVFTAELVGVDESDEETVRTGYLFSAHVALLNGDPVWALRMVNERLEDDEDYGPLYLMQARCHKAMGNTRLARKALEKARKRCTEDEDLAEVYQELGSYAEAIEKDSEAAAKWREKAAELAPKNPL